MAEGLSTSYITSTNDTPSKISFNAIRFTDVTSRTSLGVNACEQSYPISNSTLQLSRSYILLSIGLKCSQFLDVVFIGGNRCTCESDRNRNLKIRIISSDLKTRDLLAVDQ